MLTGDFMGRWRSKGVGLALLRRPMERRFRTRFTMPTRVKMMVSVVALIITPVFAVASLGVDPGAAEARGECETGNYRLAKPELINEIRIRPKDPGLWRCLGRAEAEVGQIRQSIVAYKKSLLLDPVSSIANKRYGLLLMKAGEFASAVQPLRTAIESEPNNQELHLALLEVYLRTGNSYDAATEVENLLKSGSTEVQLETTSTLIRHEQLDRAQSILDPLSKVKPDLPDAHAQLGLVLMEKQQFEDAAWELGQAVLLAPDSSIYSMGLAEVLLRWHHYSTAVEFLNGIKVRFEKLPQFQYDLAYANYGIRNWQVGISAASALLKKDPKFPGAEFLLGNCYVSGGNLDAAAAHFARAIQQDRKKTVYYSALAQVKRYQGKIREALALLAKGLALDPTDHDLIFEAALCYEKQGNLAKAEALLEQLVTAKPDLAQAHRALARVYGRLGNIAGSEKEEKVLARIETAGNAEGTGTGGENKQ
jgi:predicted Zn-dependent protease